MTELHSNTQPGRRWYREPAALAFAFLLALLTTLSFLALQTLDILEQKYFNKVEIQSSKLRLVEEMIRFLKQRQILIREIALKKDAFERDDAIQTHSAVALRYIRARNRFMALPLSVNERETIDRVVDLNKAGYETQLDIIDKLVNDLPNQAHAVLSQILVPLNKVMHNELIGMRGQLEASARTAENNAREVMLSSRQNILYLYVLALLISLAVAYFAFRLQRRQQQQLAWQATHDSLTGLINRFEFDRMLTIALEQAADENTQHALLVMDLDQFKLINDTAGHIAGDELLRQLAVRFQETLGKGPLLTRLGGDEFGILIYECELETAKYIANQVLRVVRDFRFQWLDRSFDIAGSIGIVLVTKKSENAQAIMSAVDLACYAAKETGRNRYHIYAESDKHLVQRRSEMDWATRLREALDSDRVILYKQDICLCETGEIPHHEILVRIVDKDQKIIGPDQFIPSAERFDLIQLLDLRVFELLFEYLNEGPGSNSVYAINLSGKSVGSKYLLDRIVELLEHSDIDPSKLCFEITETAAIANLTAARRFMLVLSDMGCRFALDDFGTGLSSFGYLKQLPVNYLKIDQRFIRNIKDDQADYAVVRAINDTAHALGMETIAEGVESESILDVLKELRIDYAQGFAISKPSPLIPTHPHSSAVSA
ncbi:MAG: hypothetical protein BMS9Abin15_0740 [Gammaproteobacteria bacterium]|nr:MAG: hypothetical protein BMS9Abin15_0740 [Gammaproteobacteria bacterium]